MSTLIAWFGGLGWAEMQPRSIWPWEAFGLHRFADALVSLACLVISLYLILHYLRPWRRREVPYRAIVWVIAGFLLLCGLLCSLDAIAVTPAEPLTGVISLFTAMASWTAVLALAWLVCQTRSPCDPRDFEKEINERQRAEEALKKSEAMARKLALVASRTDNAVIITDALECIEWVNEGFTRMTGYLPEEVVGRTPGSLLQGPETDQATVAHIKERIRAGEGFQAEIINYGKSGQKYWVAIEVQPIRDGSDQITNFIAVERDITDRQLRRAANENAACHDADSGRLQPPGRSDPRPALLLWPLAGFRRGRVLDRRPPSGGLEGGEALDLGADRL